MCRRLVSVWWVLRGSLGALGGILGRLRGILGRPAGDVQRPKEDPGGDFTRLLSGLARGAAVTRWPIEEKGR